MHDIMIKTFELIDSLEESELIQNLNQYKNNIENNEELKNLIYKGNHTDDKYLLMDIKNQLYQYDEYREYMHYYNELMYLVMDINSRYKKIIGNKNCLKG